MQHVMYLRNKFQINRMFFLYMGKEDMAFYFIKIVKSKKTLFEIVFQIFHIGKATILFSDKDL